jgi:hypothetical protein
MKTKLSLIKINLAAAAALLCITAAPPLYSSADLSISGSYLNAGDEGSLYGGGMIFSFDLEWLYIQENIHPLISAYYLGGKENGGGKEEISRSYVPVAAGVEYLRPLYALPLSIKVSGGGGAGYFRKEEPARYGPFTDYSKTMSNSATAPFLFLNAGVQYTLSQRVALFFDTGYHYSFMKEEWMSDPFAGVQVNAGFRIAVAGMNRALE